MQTNKEHVKQSKIYNILELCEKEFDANLRVECIDATWSEKFFWNKQQKVLVISIKRSLET